MADLTDVCDAIGGVLGAAFYPNGTASPSRIGRPVTVFTGWPPANKLDEALKTNRVLVAVFPPPNLERPTTRALSQWLVASPPKHLVTAVVAGSTVTIGGTAETGQNVGLIVNDAPVVHAVQANDTPTTIAAGLATLLVGMGRTATSVGPVLTIQDTYRLVAWVGGPGRLVKEVERTDRSFMVSVWAPTPQLRTAAGRIVRDRLCDPKFIALADGSAGWIRYERTNDSDISERTDLYRRDISYWVEFGQYVVEDAFEVIIPEATTQPVPLSGAL